jgi:phage tail-like protein
MRRGILAVAACLLAIFAGVPAGAATEALPQARTYTAVNYGLEIDGQFAGWVRSAEGGHATSDVVMEQMGADHIQRKHIAGVKYEDIAVTFGADMSKAMYDWIKASFDRQLTRKNGAIIAADYNYKEIARVEFYGALISEVGFPALDAASKDAAKMTIKFSPEYTRYKKGDGKALPLPPKAPKLWLPSKFRLHIDGLDAATRVSKIEALVVKQKVAEDAVGDGRDYQQEPASLEIPNLVITMPDTLRQGSQRFQTDAFGMDNPLYAWLDDFVVMGNNGDEQEKSGSLEYLASDGTLLFRLSFSHLGIFTLTSDRLRIGSDQTGRVKAELYCEEMRFEYSAQTAGH